MNKQNKKETDSQIHRTIQWLPEGKGSRRGTIWKGIKRYKILVTK